jgi:hypothetical protein
VARAGASDDGAGAAGVDATPEPGVASLSEAGAAVTTSMVRPASGLKRPTYVGGRIWGRVGMSVTPIT